MQVAESVYKVIELIGTSTESVAMTRSAARAHVRTAWRSGA